MAAKLAQQLREPTPYRLTEAFFLRLLGLIYLFAFASLWPQIIGLIGSHGIVPAERLLRAVRAELGLRAFYTVPSLFWISPHDGTLLALCTLGSIASLCMMLAVLPRLASLACFVLYLSITSIGEPFLSFQWDALLLETGFLALFAGAGWLVLAYRLLLFRLIFESGVVKIASHDPNWRNFHALRFHFMTQPLPNPIAYYVHHSPPGLLDALTAATLVIEFAAPFLLFFPRRPRYIGVAFLVLLQVVILFTGNYAFFNLLTLALCLWGLDDSFFVKLAPLLDWRFPRFSLPRFGPVFRIAANLCIAILVALAVIQLLELVKPRVAAPFSRPLALVGPFEIVNSYGLFAVMTTTRPEIVLEGSNDLRTWLEYNFPYKPGNTHRGLPWVAPYQPRLDWQMWFAALGDYASNTWVSGLLYRVMTSEPLVTKLLDPPPFPKPPRYMRVLQYRYEFTTPAERARTGAVWQRKLQGVWFGPVSLTGQ
jgi:hypothetical protein